jgi:hypothetical protein
MARKGNQLQSVHKNGTGAHLEREETDEIIQLRGHEVGGHLGTG